jgi:hypothetical protein
MQVAYLTGQFHKLQDEFSVLAGGVVGGGEDGETTKFELTVQLKSARLQIESLQAELAKKKQRLLQVEQSCVETRSQDSNS